MQNDPPCVGHNDGSSGEFINPITHSLWPTWRTGTEVSGKRCGHLKRTHRMPAWREPGTAHIECVERAQCQFCRLYPLPPALPASPSGLIMRLGTTVCQLPRTTSQPPEHGPVGSQTPQALIMSGTDCGKEYNHNQFVLPSLKESVCICFCASVSVTRNT